MFKCNRCNITFSTATDLGWHRRRFHTRLLRAERRDHPVVLSNITGQSLVGRKRRRTDVILPVPEQTIRREQGTASSEVESPQRGFDLQTLLNPDIPSLSGFNGDPEGDDRTDGGEKLGSLVYEFYDSFQDRTTALWKDLKAPPSLSDQGQALLDFCLENRLSSSGIKRLYDLQSEIAEATFCSKCSSQVQSTWLKEQFGSREQFYKRVLHERRFIVKEQGWREAVIKSRLGNKDKGVFRPIRHFLSDLIRKAGGPGKLVKPEKLHNEDGERLFSCATNSDGMINDYADAIRENPGRVPVYFSLYADKTMLARSGAGDGFIMRIRVENLPGYNLTWYDIAYAPTLSYSPENSDQKVREARLESFHRFLHLLLKDVIDPRCYSESESAGVHAQCDLTISPRLLCIVCDQPQEREFLGLMRGQSHQDCSQCTFQSLQDRNFNKRRRIQIAGSEAGRTINGNRIATLPIPFSEIRVTADTYESRSAKRIVALQLQVALLERKKRLTVGTVQYMNNDRMLRDVVSTGHCRDNNRIGKLKEELSLQSGLKLPSALNSVPGVVSGPARLFQLCGIDLLHAFDLGISRQFCDESFKVMSQALFNQGRSKADLIRICNRRIRELPFESGCNWFVPFKTVESEKQASFTGKHRRQLAPFLWYAVMGLNGSAAPDDDELFCAALHIDAMQAALRGVNADEGTSTRTEADVKLLQHKMEKGCEAIQSCFHSNESTKFHRIKVHLADHLFRFGNIRTVDTSMNEQLHKNVKKSYWSTNKQLANINSQLLQVNISAEMQLEPSLSSNHHALLLTRDPRLQPVAGALQPQGAITRSSSSRERSVLNVLQPYKQEKAGNEANEYLLSLYGTSASSESRVPAILASKVLHILDDFGCQLYERKSCFPLAAKYEWARSPQVTYRQIVYADDHFRRWGSRHDTVVYTAEDGSELNYAVVECILRRTRTIDNSDIEGAILALLRPLQSVSPEPGNMKIVREFGYSRLQYVRESDDVKLIIVPWHRIMRKAVRVVDMWDFARRHSHGSLPLLPSEVRDTPTERLATKFFIAKNFSFSTLGEQLLEEE